MEVGASGMAVPHEPITASVSVLGGGKKEELYRKHGRIEPDSLGVQSRYGGTGNRRANLDEASLKEFFLKKDSSGLLPPNHEGGYNSRGSLALDRDSTE